jgi:hypothetical protein
MILQTNSYIVPPGKREEHARLMRRFRQEVLRLGCNHFEVHEEVGPNWTAPKGSSRCLQIMRFRDRKHFQQVQAAERQDAAAQELIREFCELVNLPAQQQQGTFKAECYVCVTTTNGIGEDASRPEESQVQ